MLKHRNFNPHLFITILILVTITFAIGIDLLSTYVFASGKTTKTPFILEENETIEPIQFDIQNVKSHVEYLASLGSRFTGTSGNIEAAQYIYNKFKEYGLVNVSFQEFSIVVPVDKGANVTILLEDNNLTLPLHAGQPNFVVPCITPPEGLMGRLVYVGDAYLKDFEGKDIAGNIVIVNWDTEMRWLDAIRLGAKAVIFIPPMRYLSTHGRRFTKLLYRVPLNFPRFYADEEVANILLQNLGKTVVLKSTQTWENVTARNIIGFIPGIGEELGPEYKNIILLSAYYDSYSDFPSIAPGAQEACGVAALLELARILANTRPKYTLMFVAYAAHHQGIQGTINFVNEYIWPSPNPEKRNIGKRIFVNFNLDLSTGTDATYLTPLAGDAPMGKGYAYNPDANRYGPTAKFFREISEKMGRPAVLYRDTPGLQYYAPVQQYPSELATAIPTRDFQFDSAPFAASIVPPYGFTITTAYDARPYTGTPFDTLDKVNWKHLETQLEFIYTAISHYINRSLVEFFNVRGPEDLDPDNPSASIERAYSVFTRNPTGINSRWMSVKGTVAVWSMEKAFWDPSPILPLLNRSDVRVLVCLDYDDRSYHQSTYYFYRRFVFPNPNGDFLFRGGIWNTAYWSGRGAYHITAWVINSTTGNILYAPDMGVHRYGPEEYLTISYVAGMHSYDDIGFLTVFKASTMIVLDVAHPDWLYTFQTEEGTYLPPVVTVLRADTHIQPESWGLWLDNNLLMATVAVPPNIPFEIVCKALAQRYPFIILSNASEDNPLQGFQLKYNEQYILHNSYYKFARNFILINEERVQRYLPNSRQAILHSETVALLANATEAFNQKKYREYYMYSMMAWKKSAKLYVEIRTLLEDSSYSTLFFSAFIIPFIFLFERLLFGASGIKRVVSFVGTFLVFSITMYTFHPGFKIAASPLMIIVGFSILILASPIIGIIISKIGSLIAEIRHARLGKHEIKVRGIPFSTQLVHSFSIGVENMRRRKFRTGLTLITIIIVVTAVVSFSSIESMKIYSIAPSPKQNPAYVGIYIHKDHWGRGSHTLNYHLIEFVKGVCKKVSPNCSVAPRAWAYTLWPTELNPRYRPHPIAFYVTTSDTWETVGEKWIPSPVLLGFTAEESNITGIDSLLIAGRWFLPGERRVCILTEANARRLGINATNLPAKVYIENLEYRVIGIIGDHLGIFKDLDGEGITPIKLDWPPLLPNPYEIHDEVEYVTILPYEDVIALGGTPASISARFSTKEEAMKAAELVSSTVSGPLTFVCTKAGEEGEVYMIGEKTAITIHGMTTQLIPLGLVFLSILNLLLGAIYERRKEISIYSFVGISPLSIAFMFFTETLIYAILGSILGYTVGVLMLNATSTTVGLSLNFSSSMVILSLGVTMLVIVLSSIYPLTICAKLVTPSLKRKWEIPTSPVGDMWEIPLPFFLRSMEEVKSLAGFLLEFMDAHKGADAPIFSISDVKIVKEPFGLQIDDLRLFPYEMGVSQSVSILMPYSEGRWQITVVMKRIGGSIEDWERLNRGFVNTLREQLLLWTSLKSDDKTKYQKLFESKVSL